ncbi:hypothetical protein N7468_007755 [Penicillium chermesinum]|uniref:Xylanolytic transcriptional activator regulatory domain-containing protein n=1 Tax=Penicillium chermesinum TaxID=63820 RepID=A0A9W9NUN7_9EURO|nr:uncharacterized protein N7468_007755 [Penicillium chermesinum]KAJ5226530.1 hypothetical protein N7468_007755 [Penicillium chermesinum]
MQPDPRGSRRWSQCSQAPQSLKNALLPFSYYPYIRAPGIQRLQPVEMAFLESQKSTHIPAQPLLDELLKHYFLYVHPLLPLIDEAEFWSILEQRSSRNSSISILVFQAMLFVACGYIPLGTAKEWGATSILEMRTSFYKRAKTLYNFGVENDPLCRSQALALLSYESSSSDPSGNSTWLALAIQYARMVNANAYDHMPKNGSYKVSDLKRLWWCLILRDRIIALGMRRPLQILPGHFCVNSASHLEVEDLRDEINASKVYEPQAKRALAALLSSQCRLAAVLTPLIMILHPSDSDGSGGDLMSVLARADDVKVRLKYWYSQHLLISPAEETEVHQSITLFKRLNKLYYESARLALDHHLAFCLYQGRRLQSSSDLMEAVTSIHAIFKRFTIDGTASHLPISVVAFGIIPQMLMNFDLRLFNSDTRRKGPKHLSKIYQELNTLHRLRYDISHILNWMNEIILVFEDSLSSCGPQHAKALATEKQSKSYSLVLMMNRYPEQYFRLLDTMNSAVSTGEFRNPTFRMIAALPMRPPHSFEAPDS